MYPTLYHAVQDIFGIEIPFLKIVMMFGFFVALAFVLAHWVMVLEFKRHEKEGTIKGFDRPVVAPNAIAEYAISTVLGFLVGWKLSYFIAHFSTVIENPQDFVFSTQGILIWGFVGAAAFAAVKYFELKRIPEPQPGQTTFFHPYMMMGNLTVIAALSGFAGAKLFHHLEYYKELFDNPMVLFQNPFSGLTFYGGLIGGAIGVLWYASKKGVNWKVMLDIGGPAMMLAYGVGRMGCHMSGDGDWGVENLSPKPNWLNWLPDWAWSYGYEGSVLGPEHVPPNPVWPTPMYEVIMALILFGILWAIRKKPMAAGVLFSIYLIFSGIERFLIEKIRVNPKFDFLGMEMTQAEIISSSFILLGIIGIIYFTKTGTKKATPVEVTS